MPPSARSEIWERFDKSMLQGYYLAHLRENMLGAAATFEDTQINPLRRQMGNYARTADGHDADARMLRSTLLRIRRHWTRLIENDSIDTAPR
ncbi:hypothetical protein PV04_03228 [Phialophora macrospora]|uniref:Uncharacterized protein n=1 Tax=Phialophora macrospora TaxID=1851006 RepID=A0A0D2FX35_9EURO|nr:hypothetical protein PV04_03228 [Phialophora macrospora]